jgi:hypothetical protein
LKSNSSIPAFRLLTSHLARVPIVAMLGFGENLTVAGGFLIVSRNLPEILGPRRYLLELLDESISASGAWPAPMPCKRLRLPISPSNAEL